MRIYYPITKRTLDFIGALLVLILTIPITIPTAVFIFFKTKGNPFFVQKRPGKNSKPFSFLKFKTMLELKDSNGVLLPDKERMTNWGKIIRSSSIDEIPQMINIIKGEMSFIGPRPLLCSYLTKYSEKHKHRHDVSPGVTGWAQVNGRNSLSWEEKFNYDIWYVNNISLLLDFKIIVLTVTKVLFKENINNNNSETMYPFDGYQ